MARLDLQNVPQELFDRLSRRAAAHGRSLEAEVVECLAVATAEGLQSSDSRIVEIDRLRESLRDRVYVTDDELDAAINEGRP